jgi:hypothetical protein
VHGPVAACPAGALGAFGIITRRAIRRGSFENVTELIATIRAFIDGWNDRSHPFHLDQDRRRDPAPRHP